MTTSSYLANAQPLVSTYPITVAMWIILNSIGTVKRNLWALSDTATSTNYLRLGIDTFEQFEMAANAGTIEAAVTPPGGNVGAGKWQFVIARFISSTNRCMEAIYFSQPYQVAKNTSSVAPSGLDLMTLGSLSTSNGTSTSTATISNWDGLIGEFWYANSAVRNDGANLTRDQLHKIAFEGPFAFPHLAANIIEYRGFRKSLASDQDLSDDVYWGGLGRPRWTNNRVTLGPHVPTTPWYPYGYPSRFSDLMRRDVLQPAGAPAEVIRLRYPVRMDGAGYGGIFPGNRVYQKAQDG